MTTKYEYQNEIFIVSKPEDCTMKVSKDGYSVVITLGEHPGRYHIAFNDGQVVGDLEDANESLRVACQQILKKLAPVPTKDELCSGLDMLYGEISKAEA